MKTLADGTEVVARGYYYLLDFNDSDNWNYMLANFGTAKLNDLNVKQYAMLFKHATECDANKLNK